MAAPGSNGPVGGSEPYSWIMSGARPSQADLDLRLVRYFTVVAALENFSRAAAALHVAQPSLSRQIHRLEEQIGVRLLDRTARGSTLTAAGQSFLPRAEMLLQAAEQAMSLARSSAEPHTITIGFTGNLIITDAVRELRHRHPEAEVRTRHLAWHEPHAALKNHRVDAVVARMPIATDGLSVTILYREPLVVVLPTSHRLAGKELITLDDISEEPMPRFAEERWNAFWRADPRPDGRPAPDGPIVEDLEDKFELIAGGQAIALAPAGGHSGPLREDLTSVPIEGVGPGQVVLATRAQDERPLVVAFRKSAQNHLRE